MARDSNHEDDDQDTRIYSDDDLESSSEEGDWESAPQNQGAKHDRRLHSAVDEDEFIALSLRNQELAKRLAAVEWRNYSEQKEGLKNRFNEAQNLERTAEEYLAKAIAEANGDDAATAMRARDKAVQEQAQIRAQYEQCEAWERQQAAIPAKPSQDPKTSLLAKKWIRQNDWYDINGGDADSRVALQIDGQLVKDGYVPQTEIYWRELDRRLADKLPHRYEGKPQANGARARSNNKTIHISKERKEAMMAAGVWDDPALRLKYAKQYQKWDKENR